MTTKPVLVLTGAFGRIGTALRPVLEERYRLRLVDLRPPAEPLPNRPIPPAVRPVDEVVIEDLCDASADRLRDMADGASAVIHLAGNPSPAASWKTLTSSNLIATQNLLDACARTSVPTIVLASSIHAVGGHYADRRWPIGSDALPDPCCLYGVSKVAVEALGRRHAEAFGASVLAVRIGGFAEHPAGAWQLNTWLSVPDAQSFFDTAVRQPPPGYSVHTLVSRTVDNVWDLSSSQSFGYRPTSDAGGAVVGDKPLPVSSGCRLHRASASREGRSE